MPCYRLLALAGCDARVDDSQAGSWGVSSAVTSEAEKPSSSRQALTVADLGGYWADIDSNGEFWGGLYYRDWVQYPAACREFVTRRAIPRSLAAGKLHFADDGMGLNITISKAHFPLHPMPFHQIEP